MAKVPPFEAAGPKSEVCGGTREQREGLERGLHLVAGRPQSHTKETQVKRLQSQTLGKVSKRVSKLDSYTLGRANGRNSLEPSKDLDPVEVERKILGRQPSTKGAIQ